MLTPITPRSVSLYRRASTRLVTEIDFSAVPELRTFRAASTTSTGEPGLYRESNKLRLPRTTKVAAAAMPASRQDRLLPAAGDGTARASSIHAEGTGFATNGA